MSDWFLEQGINIKFCVKLGKNASDTCAVLSVWSQKQMTKFAMETANISTTQESLHVQIINEDIAHHFLLISRIMLCLNYSTRANSQPSLLCKNIEAVMWSSAYKKLELWLHSWILHHDNAAAHKCSLSSSFCPKNRLLKWNTHCILLIGSEWLLAVSKDKVCLKGAKISGYWKHPKKVWQGTRSCSATGVAKMFPTVALSLC